jgi:hypothetical protein
MVPARAFYGTSEIGVTLARLIKCEEMWFGENYRSINVFILKF